MKIRKMMILLAGVFLLAGCEKRTAELVATVEEFGEQETTSTIEAFAMQNPLSLEETSSIEYTEEESYEEPEPPSLSLVMVGDILMHTPLNETGLQENGEVNFDHLFTHTKDMISSADLALVNQEVILGGEELGISGYPNFNTYYEVGDALANAGFDVALHATNHALDRGKNGIINCLNYWENNHPEITPLGIYEDLESSDEIYIYEKEGIRVAILNYTYSTNGIPLPEGMPYAVNMMDKEAMLEDIKKAEEIADFTIVCPHWGTEYVLTPSDYQKNYADFFLECGVDLVIGTHPHVIEPMEWLRDDAGNEMLVYYSLGNFVNCTGSTTPDIGNRMVGAMASVTLIKQEDGSVVIDEYSALPLVTYVSADREDITVYPMDGFTDEMAAESYTIKYAPDFSKGFCEDLWERVFP